jgi:hypothetical protein
MADGETAEWLDDDTLIVSPDSLGFYVTVEGLPGEQPMSRHPEHPRRVPDGAAGKYRVYSTDRVGRRGGP